MKVKVEKIRGKICRVFDAWCLEMLTVMGMVVDVTAIRESETANNTKKKTSANNMENTSE